MPGVDLSRKRFDVKVRIRGGRNIVLDQDKTINISSPVSDIPHTGVYIQHASVKYICSYQIWNFSNKHEGFDIWLSRQSFWAKWWFPGAFHQYRSTSQPCSCPLCSEIIYLKLFISRIFKGFFYMEQKMYRIE